MTTDLTPATLQEIGAGITVFEEEGVIEGPALWLGSPEAVIEFVDRDDTDEFIIMARGGTTTFLTPALARGVKGIVTLQGAPTSHLGIISREYGIPCLMSVAFTAGEINERGETIPPDGTLLRLDVCTSPRGRVLAASDAGLTPTNAGPDDAETAAASTESADAVPTFANGVRGGSEGERIMVSRLKTDVLTLTEESLRRDLAENEVNDLLDFYGWKLWDILAARITEGESGLIPRQQYEVLAVHLQWRTHPRWHRVITDKIGVDGLIEVGAQARRQVGTKINPLHIWAAGLPTALGRGIAVELGIHGADHRKDDLAGAMQFTRRLYRGLWGGEGPRGIVKTCGSACHAAS